MESKTLDSQVITKNKNINQQHEEQASDEEEIDINKKDKTNFKNISYSKRDVYYRKAKEEGFRARSVYKLKELNDNFNILKDANKIIDLCSAPGSWSQMLRILTKSNPSAKIVSVDIQDIVPIEGIHIVKGDITKQETISKILSYFNNEKVDVIIFDGAHDVTGLIEIDMYMQVQLIIFSLIINLKTLKQGGKFVAKVFKDENISDFYYEKFKLVFSNVHYFKPASSRNTSHETFVICEDFSIDEEEVRQDIEKMSIEDIFSFNEEGNKDRNKILINESTKEFLRFLCYGDYN
jgi:tRNA (cytidine32/guanosine34-2'-O)-methyltransferase